MRKLIWFVLVVMTLASCASDGALSIASVDTEPAVPVTSTEPYAITPTGEYLADLAEISARLIDDQTDATRQGGPERLLRVWESTVNRIAALEPPENVQDLHTDMIRYTESFRDELAILTEAQASGNPATASAAATVFLDKLADLAAGAIETDETQIELTIVELADRTDPVVIYLRQQTELQLAAAPIVEKLFEALGQISSSPAAATRQILLAVDEITAGISDWEKLDIPPEAESIHRERLRIFREMTSVYAELGEAFNNNTDVSPSLLRSIETLGFDSQSMAAETLRFTAEVLRGLGVE